MATYCQSSTSESRRGRRDCARNPRSGRRRQRCPLGSPCGPNRRCGRGRTSSGTAAGRPAGAGVATGSGNCCWFTPDGRAALAYRVLGGIALTTSEPFGVPDARPGAVDAFARFCTDRALTPCLYAVCEQVRAHTAALGWDCVQVAEEAVIPLGHLTFTGKALAGRPHSAQQGHPAGRDHGIGRDSHPDPRLQHPHRVGTPILLACHRPAL